MSPPSCPPGTRADFSRLPLEPFFNQFPYGGDCTLEEGVMDGLGGVTVFAGGAILLVLMGELLASELKWRIRHLLMAGVIIEACTVGMVVIMWVAPSWFFYAMPVWFSSLGWFGNKCSEVIRAVIVNALRDVGLLPSASDMLGKWVWRIFLAHCFLWSISLGSCIVLVAVFVAIGEIRGATIAWRILSFTAAYATFACCLVAARMMASLADEIEKIDTVSTRGGDVVPVKREKMRELMKRLRTSRFGLLGCLPIALLWLGHATILPFLYYLALLHYWNVHVWVFSFWFMVTPPQRRARYVSLVTCGSAWLRRRRVENSNAASGGGGSAPSANVQHDTTASSPVNSPASNHQKDARDNQNVVTGEDGVPMTAGSGAVIVAINEGGDA